MQGYTRDKLLNDKDALVLQFARGRIRDVEDRSDNPFRCHEIARALAASLRAELPFNEYPYSFDVVDGNYAGVDHSWITLRRIKDGDHAGAQIILDPYAVGRFPVVQIVVLSPNSLERLYYKPDGAERSDIKLSDVLELSEMMLPAYLRED